MARESAWVWDCSPVEPQDDVICTNCGVVLTLPARSATQHQQRTAQSGTERSSADKDAWQEQLQIVITTVDDVRLCLRATVPSETKTWAVQLQRAVENNEERQRATWEVDMKHRCRPGARWMGDEEATACLDCGTSFTRWKRRHHCRNCGSLFCDECSAWDHVVPGCGEARVRVCASCLAELAGVIAPNAASTSSSDQSSSNP